MALSAGRPIPSWAVLAVLVALAMALHAPIIGCTFFSDDFQVLHRLEGNGPSSFFRPVADVALRVNLWLAGPEPWAFRLANLALLGVNGWLVHVLAKRVVHETTAVLAGALFVLYPFHLEPQAWVIGRGVAMASAFTLTALVVATSRLPVSWRSVIVGLMGLLGALCYESAFVLPVLLGAWWLLLRHAEHDAWRLVLFASVAALVMDALLRWALLDSVVNAYGAGFLAHRAVAYPAMLVKVIGRSFLPPVDNPSTQALRFTMLGLLLALLVLAYRRKRGIIPYRHRADVLFTSLFLIASLVAVLGGVSTRTSESDRFLFMPSAFLCMLMASLVQRIWNRVVRSTVLVMLLLVWGHWLLQGQRIWRQASDLVELIISETPTAPSSGRLIVQGLPGDVRGAYVFRHGYVEALAMSGKDAERVMVQQEGYAIEVRETDRIIRWNGESFDSIPEPSLEP